MGATVITAIAEIKCDVESPRSVNRLCTVKSTLSENDLQEIAKIASVKILLKQCLQKGFHVNS